MTLWASFNEMLPFNLMIKVIVVFAGRASKQISNNEVFVRRDTHTHKKERQRCRPFIEITATIKLSCIIAFTKSLANFQLLSIPINIQGVCECVCKRRDNYRIFARIISDGENNPSSLIIAFTILTWIYWSWFVSRVLRLCASWNEKLYTNDRPLSQMSRIYVLFQLNGWIVVFKTIRFLVNFEMEISNKVAAIRTRKKHIHLSATRSFSSFFLLLLFCELGPNHFIPSS